MMVKLMKVGVYFIWLLIYLAMLGLIFGTQDPSSSLQPESSLVAA